MWWEACTLSSVTEPWGRKTNSDITANKNQHVLVFMSPSTPCVSWWCLWICWPAFGPAQVKGTPRACSEDYSKHTQNLRMCKEGVYLMAVSVKVSFTPHLYKCFLHTEEHLYVAVHSGRVLQVEATPTSSGTEDKGSTYWTNICYLNSYKYEGKPLFVCVWDIGDVKPDHSPALLGFKLIDRTKDVTESAPWLHI